MGIDLNLAEWSIFFFRTLHIVTAIAWIGASFYFVWLDMNLRPVSGEKLGKGLHGELWAIHGGGIYEVQKYDLAPPKMPSTLHWFKWEAYTTWLSGTALLILLYYGRAQTYLIDDQSWVQDPGIAIASSIGLIVLSLLGYEIVVRLEKLANSWLAVLVFLWISTICWLSFHLFSLKAAPIHVGAAIATIMAANVFLGIIPGQKALVRAIESGRELDPGPALAARKRSLHNNYLTLPVVLCMLSNHSMFIYSHSWAWLVLIFLMLNASYLRHFFNLRHQGISRPGILIISSALFVVIAIVGDRLATSSLDVGNEISRNLLSDQEMMILVQQHCGNCHAKKPSFPGYAVAPGGIVLDSLQALDGYRAATLSSLKSGYMPLGNMQGLTDMQRNEMIHYLQQ